MKPLAADVTDLKAVEAFCAEVAKQLGRIVLFLNAGIAKFAPVEAHRSS